MDSIKCEYNDMPIKLIITNYNVIFKKFRLQF